MQSRLKTLMMVTGLVSVSLLSACSTFDHFPNRDGDRRFGPRDHKKPPEMKALIEQSKTLCTGKQDGQAVQAQVNGKVIDGQCELRFKPNAKPKQP